jgi:hypothetical protein
LFGSLAGAPVLCTGWSVYVPGPPRVGLSCEKATCAQARALGSDAEIVGQLAPALALGIAARDP